MPAQRKGQSMDVNKVANQPTINGIDLADHSHLRELKRLLDKLGRDEIEYRAYMRIAEAMKDD